MGFPTFIGYHELDKLLDMYYLSLEVIVVQGWVGLPRMIGSVLFAYRLAGVSLFEITDNRLMLFIFPNLFELFFLFCAYTRRYRPTYVLTEGAAAMSLAVLLMPKMAQEYVLHCGRLLDNLVAADIVIDIATDVFEWLRGLTGT